MANTICSLGASVIFDFRLEKLVVSSGPGNERVGGVLNLRMGGSDRVCAQGFVPKTAIFGWGGGYKRRRGSPG